MPKTILLSLLLILVSCGSNITPKKLLSDTFDDLKKEKSDVESYKDRYGVTNVTDKIVDNVGEGEERLYGARNVRVLLYGISYRGGANNYYHRDNPRNNMNPLPEDGLMNLCQEGFKKAVYLYTTRFETATKTTSCSSFRDSESVLNYYKLPPENTNNMYKILEMTYQAILDQNQGPIYIHCWNGWHASGLASAITLRQFCSYDAEKAVRYWDANTDGNNTDPNYQRIRDKIRAFEPYPEFTIQPIIQTIICPDFEQNYEKNIYLSDPASYY